LKDLTTGSSRLSTKGLTEQAQVRQILEVRFNK
jgi:hypothetical protein